jgi:hypothetical protein
MTAEIINDTVEKSCGCEDGTSCAHTEEAPKAESLMETLTKQRGVDGEVALAFLLALTPLVVLTFFGQIGLI